MMLVECFYKGSDKTRTGKDLTLLTFCINHTPLSPATKTIRAHICSAANPMVLTRKLKIPPTILPTIASNASTAFPASLLSVSANLSNHFFKAPSPFSGEPSAPLPHPKTPVIARTIIEIVIERAVNMAKMLIPCS